MNNEIWYGWHFTEDEFPHNDGSYLCYTEDGYYIICKFSNHLYDIDSNDFCDGGEKGFYRGNSTLGYQRYDAILCWTHLPRSQKIKYCPYCSTQLRWRRKKIKEKDNG